MNDVESKINDFDKRIEELEGDKTDLENDLFNPNGLRQLKPHFARQKKELELTIHRLSNQCQSLHKQLEELNEEEVHLNKQIV